MTQRLITIPFSHYCEKARWALQWCGVAFREESHLPLLHLLPARRAGGRTLPILVRPGEPSLVDSTEIVCFADAQAAPARRLFPDGSARFDAERLEDDFDERLGPATRLWVYAHGLAHPQKLRRAVAPSLTLTQARALPLLLPLARPLIRRRYGIVDARVRAAEATIEAVFAEVGARLSGRRYLVGDRFGAADLTFAALAAPVLLPSRHPSLAAASDELPPAMGRLVEKLRATVAGAWVLRLYEEHRDADDGALARGQAQTTA
jgi:glutathione S-transferase